MGKVMAAACWGGSTLQKILGQMPGRHELRQPPTAASSAQKDTQKAAACPENMHPCCPLLPHYCAGVAAAAAPGCSGSSRLVTVPWPSNTSLPGCTCTTP